MLADDNFHLTKDSTANGLTLTVVVTYSYWDILAFVLVPRRVRAWFRVLVGLAKGKVSAVDVFLVVREWPGNRNIRETFGFLNSSYSAEFFHPSVIESWE